MAKRVPETGVRVLAVRPGGLAATAGLLPGDRLLRVNGHALRDLVDLHVHAGEECLRIDVDRGGEARGVVVSRRWGEDLGLECEPPVPGEISTCANKCVFCFIHQLPRGMRRSLYVKDDDYRLSFLHGNYITLTDLPDAEIERIVENRLSPLYVSVHATDPALRHRLLGSPRAVRGDLLERMARLAAGGIRMHAQIVLCPGINDGPHLDRTIRELAALAPAVTTAAVVPVGLTRHREGLPALRPVTEADARTLVTTIQGWQERCLGDLGTRFVFAADELYLRAGIAIPSAPAYEGFPVVEDGVGLVRRFEDELARIGRQLPRPVWKRRRSVAVVTGELFGPRLAPAIAALDVPGLTADVVAVPNEFFGRSITVAGLLTGQDVARALGARPPPDVVLVPRVALQETRGVFLDDVSPDDLARHLGVRIETPAATARGLVDALLGRPAAAD